MRKVASLVGLVVLLSLIASSAAQGTDAVSGKYEGVAKSDAIADVPITGHLKNEGGRLSGKLDTAQSSASITSGTYADGRVTMRLDASGVELVLVGELKGDKIVGTWEMAGVKGSFELKKVGAATPISSSGNTAADQIDRKPIGEGVLWTSTLTRSEWRASYGWPKKETSCPAWRVDLKLSNTTATSAQLGSLLVVIEPAEGRPEYASVYIARHSTKSDPRLHMLEERYGLMWGAEVREGGFGIWPLARVASHLSDTDAFMLAVSSPGVTGQGIESGRYGQLAPRSQRQITEEVLFPIGIRTGRSEVVVIPPSHSIPGKPVHQQILRFNVVGSDPLLGQTFALSGGETVTLVPANLIRIIESESEAMWKRVFALSWLAETSEKDATPPLTRYATAENGSEPLQLSAISNLGALRVKLAVEPLAGLLAKGNERIKARVIQALGEIGDPSAIPHVRPFLKDNDLKALAMESVGKLKDNDSIPFLLSQMRKDSREETIPAAESLALIATEPAVDGLIALASDKGAPKFVRLRAFLALESIGSAKALPAAVAVLADKKQSELHRWAVEVVIALVKKGSTEARDVLTKVAADSSIDSSVADSAREALGLKK